MSSSDRLRKTGAWLGIVEDEDPPQEAPTLPPWLQSRNGKWVLLGGSVDHNEGYTLQQLATLFKRMRYGLNAMQAEHKTPPATITSLDIEVSAAGKLLSDPRFRRGLHERRAQGIHALVVGVRFTAYDRRVFEIPVYVVRSTAYTGYAFWVTVEGKNVPCQAPEAQ